MSPDDSPSQSAALVAATPIDLRILSDGLAGHEAQTLGIAEALGVVPDLRRVHPRKFYELLAPFGPVDPRETEARFGSPIAFPWPDIALGAGRRTLPYLKRLKRISGRKVFTVYVNRPATGARAADLVIAPLHDGLFGRTVVTPVTPANRITPELLARLRLAPDPRIAALPAPRAALLVGGDNRHFKFTPPVATALQEAVRALFAAGYSVMATASRRTPASIIEALKPVLAEGAGWLWDGAGDNPYFSMLACADIVLVTADSVSMIGEAAATGAPVHIFAPSGKSGKIGDYLARLQSQGAVRPWGGAAERWSYAPVNSTPDIAAAILRAYAIFKGSLAPLPEWRPDDALEDESGEDEDCDEAENG